MRGWTKPVESRFWSRVVRDPETDCWEWLGVKNTHGYGSMSVLGKPTLAHRLAYTLLVGPIPEGRQLDHLCRNRGCVNPAHLEPVTNRVNVLRGEGVTAANARKTHCKRGHPFDDENTYWIPPARTGRACRACAKRPEVKERRAARLRKATA